MNSFSFPFAVIGLNHKSSPIELRERVSFSSTQRQTFLALFKEHFPNGECVILSTCNRVEIYFGQSTPEPLNISELTTLFTRFHNISHADLTPLMYTYSSEKAITHLFEVISGLDSLVVGESQILGQVKESYHFSLESNFTGKILNRIFQKAFSVSKRIRTETRIGEGNVSISSIACQLAEEVLGTFYGRKVLLIGTGKIGKLTLKSLRQKGAESIFIANRTPEKARHVADEFQGTAIPFDDIVETLADMDVAVTCTSFPYYILDPKLMKSIVKNRNDRQLFLIDLAVPRDIDPEVQHIPSVHLYNVDSLKNIANKNLSLRTDEMHTCRKIIRDAVQILTQDHDYSKLLKIV